jgi:DNA repair protein RadC
VEDYLKDIKDLAQEVFLTVSLNVRNQVIQRHLVAVGTVSSAVVHPRECFRPAILDGASSVIFAHNHPSGDPSPSAEDIQVTRRLILAGQHIGIQVLDHVVIGEKTLSIREAGLCEFN